MGYLIKQLKNLQDNLGDFNDLCVQQETLHAYLKNQLSANRSPVNIAAAIGGLIANLNRQQQEVRAVFTTTFEQFDQQKNRELFYDLFKK
jgi:CHAD domain-containing protein